MRANYDCDVLIVGGGAAGLSASMLLAQSDIKTILVNRYPGTSPLPKAHLLFQKTMEMFRELGLEAPIRVLGTPLENWRYVSWFAGFAGPHPDYGRQIARLQCWGGGFRDKDWIGTSHCPPANLPQSRLEPILKQRAEALSPGAVRFNTNLERFDQDDRGVTALVEDRATGGQYEIRARYMLACDGGRTVGPQLGIEMEGSPGLATNISVHFSADLSAYARDPEVLIRGLFEPETGTTSVLVPMGPGEWGLRSQEWVLHFVSWPGEHKTYGDAEVVERLQKALRIVDFTPTVHVINRWPLDAIVASTFRAGRTFILGDAAHRMPPTGGHGLNTAVQDSYNLCWKIAAVIKGYADEALLDSYEAERRPTAQRVVRSALDNWANQRHLMSALGFGPQNTAEQNWRSLRAVWGEGADCDAARRRLALAFPYLTPTYNHLNVSFGYSYDAGAIVPDGSPAQELEDRIQTYKPTTRPGHPVPHAWVEDIYGRTAIGDLIGSGRFALIAGEDGGAWRDAAVSVAEAMGLPLTAFTIGTRTGDHLDLRCEWHRVREISSQGAVLVRPDRMIAWRSPGAVADPEATLRAVFAELFGRPSAGDVDIERALETTAVPA